MGMDTSLLYNLHGVLFQELSSMQEMGIKSMWSRVRAKGRAEQGQH